MTKMHFEAFAREIAGFADGPAKRTAAEVIIRVARQFNPRFDRERFLAACDIGPGFPYDQ